MKKLFISNLVVFVILMLACSTEKIAPDPTFGKANVDLDVFIGKDSIVRTSSGSVVGKIDKKGNIHDTTTSYIIGKRKLTDSEIEAKNPPLMIP